MGWKRGSKVKTASNLRWTPGAQKGDYHGRGAEAHSRCRRVASHAPGYRKEKREFKGDLLDVDNASVIAPTAPVAASVPAPRRTSCPLPHKSREGPALAVVARRRDFWDEADEILTLECVPNVAASYPRCAPSTAYHRSPRADLSVRFRFRNPSVIHLKTRLTLGTPLPCSLGGEHADIQVDVKDKWTAEVMVKAPDRPGQVERRLRRAQRQQPPRRRGGDHHRGGKGSTSSWSGSQRSAGDVR